MIRGLVDLAVGLVGIGLFGAGDVGSLLVGWGDVGV